MMKEERYEETAESWTLAVTDAAGEPRELLAMFDEESGVVSVTVFHDTEHTLFPLYPAPAKELTRWLVERVGLPAGLEYRAGRLEHVG